MESESGSFQSHFSTANSLQRLRATSSYASTWKGPLDAPHEFSQSQSWLSHIASFFPPLSPLHQPAILPIIRQPRSNSWAIMCLKWIAFVYCCLSLIFLSVATYKQIFSSHLYDLDGARSEAETLEQLSTAQRLARISSFQPFPKAFDPFLLRGDHPTDIKSVTACIWSTDEEDLKLLVSWAAQWLGPISLLMVTAAKPHSPKHEELLYRLQSLRSYPALHKLSLHLLHLEYKGQGSPNMYLNFARLFAPTVNVMIFPANLSIPPAQEFHAAIQGFRSVRQPAIVSTVVQPSFPFLPLSPIILRRDHLLWCTQRFFFHNTRTSDWHECLWQLWLESFGEFGHINVTTGASEEARVAIPSYESKIHNRIIASYRAETCDIAIKRMELVRSPNYKDSKRNLAWLKHFCSQVCPIKTAYRYPTSSLWLCYGC